MLKVMTTRKQWNALQNHTAWNKAQHSFLLNCFQWFKPPFPGLCAGGSRLIPIWIIRIPGEFEFLWKSHVDLASLCAIPKFAKIKASLLGLSFSNEAGGTWACCKIVVMATKTRENRIQGLTQKFLERVSLRETPIDTHLHPPPQLSELKPFLLKSALLITKLLACNPWITFPVIYEVSNNCPTAGQVVPRFGVILKAFHNKQNITVFQKSKLTNSWMDTWSCQIPLGSQMQVLSASLLSDTDWFWYQSPEPSQSA